MRTCAPIETGIRPPLSIIRPALISRSASLAIASIRAGVGPRMGWDEVTIYMKRIAELPLRRVAAVIARKTGSLWETTNGMAPDRQAPELFCPNRPAYVVAPRDVSPVRFPESKRRGANLKLRAFRLGTLGALAILMGISTFASASAHAAAIVALGASNTYGKGVARNQAYPAQLEAILRAKRSNVRVVNAGINGDTTEGMLGRLDRAVPNGTSAGLWQPGGDDRGKGRRDRTAGI